MESHLAKSIEENPTINKRIDIRIRNILLRSSYLFRCMIIIGIFISVLLSYYGVSDMITTDGNMIDGEWTEAFPVSLRDWIGLFIFGLILFFFSFYLSIILALILNWIASGFKMILATQRTRILHQQIPLLSFKIMTSLGFIFSIYIGLWYAEYYVVLAPDWEYYPTSGGIRVFLFWSTLIHLFFLAVGLIILVTKKFIRKIL